MGIVLPIRLLSLMTIQKLKKKTKVKKRTLEPTWKEGFYFTIADFNTIRFTVKDYNRFRHGGVLGYADVAKDALKEGVENQLLLPLKGGGENASRGSGFLHVIVRWTPGNGRRPVQHLEPWRDDDFGLGSESRDRTPDTETSYTVSSSENYFSSSSKISSVLPPAAPKLESKDSAEAREPPKEELMPKDKRLGLLTIANIKDGSSQRIIAISPSYKTEYEVGVMTEGCVMSIQVGTEGAVLLGYDNFQQDGTGWFQVGEVHKPARLCVSWTVKEMKRQSDLKGVLALFGGGAWVSLLLPLAFLFVFKYLHLSDPYLEGAIHSLVAFVLVRVAVMLELQRSEKQQKHERDLEMAENFRNMLKSQRDEEEESNQAPKIITIKMENIMAIVNKEEEEEDEDEVDLDYRPRASRNVEERSVVDARPSLPASPGPMHKAPFGLWGDSDPLALKVRGPTYLTDRKKVPATHSMFRLAHVEIFSHTFGMISHAANRYDSWLRQQKEPPPFCFIVNWQVPGEPRINTVFYFVAKTAKELAFIPDLEAQQAVFNRTLERFLDGSKGYRHSRFKMIPRVVEGGWPVRRGVGTTPAILGTKLTQTYFRSKDSGKLNYFEVDVDVGSSKVAGQILRLVKNGIAGLIVELSFLIEGQQPDELPECLLGGARLQLDIEGIPMMNADGSLQRPLNSRPPSNNALFPGTPSKDVNVGTGDDETDNESGNVSGNEDDGSTFSGQETAQKNSEQDKLPDELDEGEGKVRGGSPGQVLAPNAVASAGISPATGTRKRATTAELKAAMQRPRLSNTTLTLPLPGSGPKSGGSDG
eukprot:gb/GEZN01001579.1/.p1 GENE.gb/GEZN01001579.1/~~gb/GEZN01001579.1/.p1  ORF type:complete len:814 (+),score=118.35 gb/GEZN01001579.1/:300-2741(+)